MAAPVIPPIPPTNPPSSAVAYVLTVLGVVFCALAAIVLIEVARPTSDNLPLSATIIGFAGASIASIAALIKSERVEAKVDDVHVTLNSRLTEWMTAMQTSADARAVAARAEGVASTQPTAPGQPP